MVKAKIANCHEASIRKDVTDPDILEETLTVLPVGSTVLAETDISYWSWKDKEYYKVDYGMNSEEGFILKDLISL